VVAIRVLAEVRPDALAAALPALLEPGQPHAVQLAAARSLSGLTDRDLARRILDGWAGYATGTRRELLAALLRSKELVTALLEAVEQEKLAVAELDPATRDALLRVPDAETRRRAQALLRQQPSANRDEVLRRYQPALSLAGQARGGSEVFAKHCQ